MRTVFTTAAGLGATLCACACLCAGASAATGTTGATGAAALGQDGSYVLDQNQVAGNTSADVNLYTGGLVVTENDLTTDPSTYNVAYSRYYNSMSAGSTELGPGWLLSVGPDVSLTIGANSIAVAGPSGYVTTFTKSADGSWMAPVGFDGSLTQNGDGSFTLTQASGADTLQFSAQGQLTGATDGAGNAFTVQDTSAAGKTVLSSYGTPDGRRINVSYDGNSRIREIDDPASTHRYYTYNAQGQLASYQGPTGTETYGYDSNGHLNTINEPDGSSAAIVTLPNGQVGSITVHPADNSGDQTTTYAYAPGVTTVTNPDGSQQTYDFDANGQLEEDPGVDQAAVGYLTEKDGISAAQAEADLQTQNAATPLDGLLQHYLGSGYVGMWFDDSDAHVEIGLTPDASQATAAAILASAGLSGQADYVVQHTSFGALQSGEMKLQSTLSDMAKAGNVQLSIVPNQDAVQIEEANDLTTEQQLEVAEAQGSVTIPTTTVVAPESSLVGETDSGSPSACFEGSCNRPLRGGQLITAPGFPYLGCSAGFLGHGVNGGTYIFTAGHCLDPTIGSGYTGVNAVWSSDTADDEFSLNASDPGKFHVNLPGRSFGTAAYGFFAGAGKVPVGSPETGDGGVIKVNTSSYWGSGLKPNVTVYNSATTQQDLTYPILHVGLNPSEADLHANTYVVCEAGPNFEQGRNHQPTAKETCGDVEDVNAIPNLDNHLVFGLVMFDSCANGSQGMWPGTSGSPVYKNHVAYGTVSGDLNCDGFYQPIVRTEKNLQVNVVTG